MLIFFASIHLQPAQAEVEEPAQEIQLIRRPTMDALPHQSIERTLNLDLSKMKHGTKVHGKIKFIQIKDKVRIEFEGTELFKGNYSITAVANCSAIKNGKIISPKDYQKQGSELFRFFTEFGSISTEQNSKEISLLPEDAKFIGDKSIAFYHVQKTKITALDCMAVGSNSAANPQQPETSRTPANSQPAASPQQPTNSPAPETSESSANPDLREAP